MNNCTRCGTGLRAGVKFCATCGSSLTPPAASGAGATDSPKSLASSVTPNRPMPYTAPADGMWVPVAATTRYPSYAQQVHVPAPRVAVPRPPQPQRRPAVLIFTGIFLGVAVAGTIVVGVLLARGGTRGHVNSPPPFVPVAPVTQQTAPSTVASAPVPTDDERRVVRQTLLTYFDSIERRDYETAFELRVWNKNPGVSRQEALGRFITEYSTTTYEEDIGTTNFRYDGADILVDVSFTSHQAADKAPPGGGTCTTWDLYYRMERVSNSWLIRDAKVRSDPGYRPC